MSKIGRKPIDINGVQVDVKNKAVHYKGTKSSGVHQLPSELRANLDENKLILSVDDQSEKVKKSSTREVNRVWGLHRALLANEIAGAAKEFQKLVKINGLGYKAQVSGKKITFTLGYSHKIDFTLPENVEVEVDRSGQQLTLKSSDKASLGAVVSEIEALRPTEPYKGTGIYESNKFIVRKAGKAKSS